MANDPQKRESSPISPEEVLRRMLNTPPKKHSEMVERKTKRPGNKK